MDFSIANWSAWAGGLESANDWQQWAQNNQRLSQDLALPKLAQIPAMQRRRLSPFAKITLHCALEAGGDYVHDIPAIFSSRHGDLNRTAELIKNVAEKEVMSPTQFGLSVHNAVAGLFSIQMNNTQPITAVSAGEASFIAGLIDAIAKLKANKYERVLYVYSDLIVPEIYRSYVASTEESIAIALLLEPLSSRKSAYRLESVESKEEKKAHFPPLSFMRFLLEPSLSSLLMQSGAQNWLLSRNA